MKPKSRLARHQGGLGRFAHLRGCSLFTPEELERRERQQRARQAAKSWDRAYAKVANPLKPGTARDAAARSWDRAFEHAGLVPKPQK